MPRKLALSALVFFVVATAVVGTASALVADDGPSLDGDSPVVGAGPAATSQIPNTTSYLSIDSPERQTYVRSDVDVTAAAGMSVERLQTRHANRVFDSQFESATGSESERVSLVRDTADSVEGELARLDARHNATVRAYNNGSISSETFLRRSARLSVEAEMASDRLDHAANRVDDDPGTSIPVALDSRLSNLRTDLITLPNPVTDRVEMGLAGQRDPLVVYAAGAGSALVLGTVDGGEFVRTATLRDEFAPDRPDQFQQSDEQALATAFDRGNELYPWAYNNAIGGAQISGPLGNLSAYRISIEHSHGSIRTYLSGGTRNAFHEIQFQRPDGVPVTGTASNENSSLEVTVETTTASGPMRVSLGQPTTGASLDGTVRVDGQVVGRTGNDGQLWTVQPSGQFRVNATTDDNSVEVVVT